MTVGYQFPGIYYIVYLLTLYSQSIELTIAIGDGGKGRLPPKLEKFEIIRALSLTV